MHSHCSTPPQPHCTLRKMYVCVVIKKERTQHTYLLYRSNCFWRKIVLCGSLMYRWIKTSESVSKWEYVWEYVSLYKVLFENYWGSDYSLLVNTCIFTVFCPYMEILYAFLKRTKNIRTACASLNLFPFATCRDFIQAQFNLNASFCFVRVEKGYLT